MRPLTVEHKIEIYNIVSALEKMSESSIEDVVEFADSNGLCIKDDSYNKYIKENEYVYSRVKDVKYQEFQNLYYYLEGFTPFSTQHKIKGSEFENVFVVLDNGKWNKFNFEYLFSNKTENESVFLRTKKIFYVCCTRAKENLIVFYHNPNDYIVAQAVKWFGVDNVHKM
ncbi:superfamily I DNA/RNA helicase [Paenibacillus sp. V4I3]|uniref:3'-5' exonuclease n=1 Tax=unclassified Paenibacillus TaxID=185978 RepID=UPI002789746F|nr:MULTISPECIES: 3'-5' exonuclease [unclassified Paenibacillus]MDQ0874379.1 superfamily I DNA/RNA helicase [Paenibacillus sp. V4I3]MDQ0897448.1 superfamily I DNA/RNA helicase [Paenibacillus sp. V4I7]